MSDLTVKIRFEKADRNHQKIIFEWLSEPHMIAFWDNTQEHKDDILNYINGRKQHYFYGTTKYWVAIFDNHPYAFILTDEIKRSEEDLPDLLRENLSKTGKTISLDFGIGNKDFLGKGLAAVTLEAFIKFYQSQVDHKADIYFIDPDEHNTRAIHVYQKAGFKIVGKDEPATKGGFIGKRSFLMVRRLPTDENKYKKIETSLRYKVLFRNKQNQKMNLLDRMKHYHVNGVSIAVIDKGKTVRSSAFGYADILTKEPLTTNTLLQAGSLSKTVTTLGILYLAQQKIVSLDKNVNHYLKSWHVHDNKFTKHEKVTLRRILSHTAGLSISGFPGYEVGLQIPTTIEILDGIKPPANTDPVKVDIVPGKKWRYSGGGTTIAQLLIEDVTTQPFADWMEKNILLPLEMTHSTFRQPPSQQYAIASGHDSKGKRIDGKYHIYPEMAAAGLWSTPTDLATFIYYLQKNSNNDFISAKLIEEMFKKQIHIMGPFNQGLGLFLQNLDDDILFFHDGQDKGFIANYSGLLNEKCGFVIMMNSNANGWYLLEEIKNSIADIYQWKNFSPIFRTVDVGDSKLYTKFSGNYLSKESGRKIIISSNDNQLFFQEHEEMPEIELHAENNYLYFTQEGNHVINFNEHNFDELFLTDHQGNLTKYNRIKK